MAQDFARKKSSPRKKAPARKKQPARGGSGGGNGLRWYGAGVITGVFLSFLLYLGTLPPAGPPASTDPAQQAEPGQLQPLEHPYVWSFYLHARTVRAPRYRDRAILTRTSHHFPGEAIELRAKKIRAGMTPARKSGRAGEDRYSWSAKFCSIPPKLVLIIYYVVTGVS